MNTFDINELVYIVGDREKSMVVAYSENSGWYWVSNENFTGAWYSPYELEKVE